MEKKISVSKIPGSLNLKFTFQFDHSSSRGPAGFRLEPPRPTWDLARYPSRIPGRDVMPGNRSPVGNP